MTASDPGSVRCSQICSDRYFILWQLLKSQMRLPKHHSSPVLPPLYPFISECYMDTHDPLFHLSTPVSSQQMDNKGFASSAACAQTGAYVLDVERRRKRVHIKRLFWTGAAGSLSLSVGEYALQSDWQHSQGRCLHDKLHTCENQSVCQYSPKTQSKWKWIAPHTQNVVMLACDRPWPLTSLWKSVASGNRISLKESMKYHIMIIIDGLC